MMDFLFRERSAAIVVPEKILQVIIFPDNGEYTAYCPQFDLATSQATPEDVLKDIIYAIEEYIEDYMNSFNIYSKSPNRAGHSSLIQKAKEARSRWELRELIEVRYGEIYIRPVQKSA